VDLIGRTDFFECHDRPASEDSPAFVYAAAFAAQASARTAAAHRFVENILVHLIKSQGRGRPHVPPSSRIGARPGSARCRPLSKG
jgi:hypothetical protein